MNKKEIKISFINIITFNIVLVILVIVLSLIILKTDILKNSINKTTASYISTYNKTTTDMLEINNIAKMSDSKGKSNRNKSELNINVRGDKEKEYEIVLYSKVNNIPNEHIKVFIEDKVKRLSELEDSLDNGKIIYKGKKYNKNMILRLWIDNEYKESIKNNSFEVKIKPR